MPRADKRCIRCGLRVYRVVSPGGYHFWVTSPVEEPWGKAVCAGHRGETE